MKLFIRVGGMFYVYPTVRCLMRKEKARAIAICALIDDAIKYGYPCKNKGRMFMDAAIHWLEDDRHLTSRQSRAAVACADFTICDKVTVDCTKSCPWYNPAACLTLR